MWWFKKKQKTPNVAFCLQDDRASVAAVDEKKRLLFCHCVDIDTTDKEGAYLALKHLVERYALAGLACTLVLPFHQYQLLMTDRPDVASEEMAKALRWRIKGLVNYPVNDVVLDVFAIPEHGLGKKRKKVFVAAVKESFLKAQIALFERVLVDINKVDIADLAERNLLTFYRKQLEPQIILSLALGVCHISIDYTGNIYLVRQLQFERLTSSNEVDDNIMQQLLLEVQRSIDYCIGELKLPEPSTVILMPNFYSYTQIKTYFAEQLTQKIVLLDVSNYFLMSMKVNFEQQRQCLNSLSAALFESTEKVYGVVDATG